MFITTNSRHRAASIALISTIGLTALKMTVAYYSHSVGVFSEGVHSFLDLISAAAAYFTVRVAGQPADENHPFGHGKIETLSSLFESILLLLAAVLITFEGIDHVLHPEEVEHASWAIASMGISLVVSYAVYRHNRSAAEETESSALHVNALHFLTDAVASIGVLLGLLVLKLTGWTLMDPLMAFAVAIYILLVSVKQVKFALRELSDTQLPEDEIQTIRKIIATFEGRIIEFHDLRTRKSGPNRHIDFHLTVCGNLSVLGSHQVCDEIEAKILETFPRASVNIHVEPCEKDQHQCPPCHLNLQR